MQTAVGFEIDGETLKRDRPATFRTDYFCARRFHLVGGHTGLCHHSNPALDLTLDSMPSNSKMSGHPVCPPTR